MTRGEPIVACSTFSLDSELYWHALGSETDMPRHNGGNVIEPGGVELAISLSVLRREKLRSRFRLPAYRLVSA